MRIRLAPLLLIAPALLLSACGSDDETNSSSQAEEQSSSPQTAITEIGATQAGLAEALATYTGGNEAGAADAVSETYLNHFELVEGPLEEVDPELTEQLENSIREELVDAMEAGDPVPQVAALAAKIDRQLTSAAIKLKAG